MQMSNISGVDVRGFGNKLFICHLEVFNYFVTIGELF